MTILSTLPAAMAGRLVNDAIIADLLSMSRSWVRKERFNRRHGLPHSFTVDPVMVGSVPRYRIEDVEAYSSVMMEVTLYLGAHPILRTLVDFTATTFIEITNYLRFADQIVQLLRRFL